MTHENLRTLSLIALAVGIWFIVLFGIDLTA